MTPSQLAQAVQVASPRVQLMVEALLQAQVEITGHHSGKIELAYLHTQVKINMSVNLGCYKFDTVKEIA